MHTRPVHAAVSKKATRGPPSSFAIRVDRKLFCCRLGRCGCSSFCSCLCFCGFCSCLFGCESLSGCNLLGFDACLLLGQSLTLGVVELAGAGAGVLDDTGSLTAQVAQVVELGATDLTAANDFDAFDHRRVNREYALDAFAVGNLADREVFLQTAAGASDANAFIGLNAGTVAFRDLHVDAKGVASGEFGKRAFGFDLGSLFGFQLLNDVHNINLVVASTARAPERSILGRTRRSRRAIYACYGKGGYVCFSLVVDGKFPMPGAHIPYCRVLVTPCGGIKWSLSPCKRLGTAFYHTSYCLGIVQAFFGFFRVEAFRAAAARMSAFSASSSISSFSLISMARRVLPSRLELKREVGSSSEAPFAKVSFTTLL
ncbi:hypothetical protein RHSP_41939 [Rhizobium freirei PRF 81]|uniref:Uncharacterized protein n=1 Tax=Rhizobium freirei PRF 81 TaxID=363754 RepID=N6UVT5_9HYPH|nr:hypothetical protein RHSP_41939 [Rhizobium freirei PRF 81]